MTIIEKLTADITCTAKRVDNDVYGNPRYYVPVYMFPMDISDKTRSKAGLVKYRGKRYGSGYVVQSYNIKGDIKHAVETVLEAYGKGW